MIYEGVNYTKDDVSAELKKWAETAYANGVRSSDATRKKAEPLPREKFIALGIYEGLVKNDNGKKGNKQGKTKRATVWGGGNTGAAKKESVKKDTSKMGKMKSRMFTITQYFNNPKTGEKLWSTEEIEDGLNHKTLKNWAWVVHDKDEWHDFDAPFILDGDGKKVKAVDENGEAKLDEIGEEYYQRDMSLVGKPRPAHAHIVLQASQRLTVEAIARWFHVPLQYVEIKSGAGTFLDCVEYLTHEADKQQDAGKHRYDDSEIHANEDLKWREMLDKRNNTKIKYGKDLSLKDSIQMDILEGVMTVNDVLKSDDVEIKLLLGTDSVRWLETLYRARATYIQTLTPPTTRINYYITGKGGSGKGLLTKALARSLYGRDVTKTGRKKDDNDIFYEVGQAGNLFDSYDGQPVIIWNDFRGTTLLKALGSRGDVFNVFDSHPTSQRFNKKFGEVVLNNQVNIVNSVESPVDFVRDIVSEQTYANGSVKQPAEDPSQVMRRFPMMIFVDAKWYQLFVSEGFLDPNKEYGDYISNEKMTFDLREAIEASGGATEIYRIAEEKTTGKVVAVHRKLEKTERKDEYKSIGGEVYETDDVVLNLGSAVAKIDEQASTQPDE